MSDPILTYILPVLLSKLKSDSADIRFLSLMIFQEIIVQYVGDDSIYDLKTANSSDSQINSDGNNVKVSTK